MATDIKISELNEITNNDDLNQIVVNDRENSGDSGITKKIQISNLLTPNIVKTVNIANDAVTQNKLAENSVDNSIINNSDDFTFNKVTAGSSSGGKTVNFNGIDYDFPATQGGPGQILTNDGSGVLSWTAGGGGSGSRDTSGNYNLTSNLVKVNRGNPVSITLNTQGINNGTQVPYTIGGSNVSVDDFTDLTSLNGVFNVTDDTDTVTLNLREKDNNVSTDIEELVSVGLEDIESRRSSVPRFGQSVSMNAAGNRVVICAPGIDFPSGNIGATIVYQENEDGTWSQMGQTIYGETNAFGNIAEITGFGNLPGYSNTNVSMNAAGDRIIIGMPMATTSNGSASGKVRIFSYNANSNTWSQLGSDIIGNVYELLGFSVSMNDDGNRIAIGAPSGHTSGTISAHVRIFSYNANSNTWSQLGTDISDKRQIGRPYERIGFDVSINASGDTVAFSRGNGPGLVRIYSYDGVNWSQKGSDITYNLKAADLFGFSVSLNGTGNIVAIGDPQNGEYPLTGVVQIFSYDTAGGDWSQLGQDITAVSRNYFGYSVSLNTAGDRVAIGAPLPGYHDTGNRNAGSTEIYYYNGARWIQSEPTVVISNGQDYDRSGFSVSMNSAGSRVVIGAPAASASEGNVAGSSVAQGTFQIYSLAFSNTGTGTGTSTGSIAEQFTLTLDNGQDSINVLIGNDNAPQYTLSKSAAYANQDIDYIHEPYTHSGTYRDSSILTVTLNTTNVSDGTVIPFNITGTGISSTDLIKLVSSDGSGGNYAASLSDEFIVNNNKAEVFYKARIDSITEGTETFTIALANGLAEISCEIREFTSTALGSNPQTSFWILYSGASAAKSLGEYRYWPTAKANGRETRNYYVGNITGDPIAYLTRSQTLDSFPSALFTIDMQDHYNRYHSGDWMGDANFRAGVDAGYTIQIMPFSIEVDVSDFLANTNIESTIDGASNTAWTVSQANLFYVFADPGPADVAGEASERYSIASLSYETPVNGKIIINVPTHVISVRSRSRYLHVYPSFLLYSPLVQSSAGGTTANTKMRVSLAASSSMQVRVGLAVGGSTHQSFNENGAGKMQELLNSTAANNKWVLGSGFGYNPITTWPETPIRTLGS